METLTDEVVQRLEVPRERFGCQVRQRISAAELPDRHPCPPTLRKCVRTTAIFQPVTDRRRLRHPVVSFPAKVHDNLLVRAAHGGVAAVRA